MSIYKNEGGKAVRYGGITTVDSTLSKESMNPIQNKVVTEALDTKPDVFVTTFDVGYDSWIADTIKSYDGNIVNLYSVTISYDTIKAFLDEHAGYDFIVNVMFDYNTVAAAAYIVSGLCSYCKMDIDTGIIKIYALNSSTQTNELYAMGKLFITAIPVTYKPSTIIDGMTNAI